MLPDQNNAMRIKLIMSSEKVASLIQNLKRFCFSIHVGIFKQNTFETCHCQPLFYERNGVFF